MSEVSNIRPVEYKILIEVDQTETVTAGGIILPETTREKQQIAQEQGRIIAMGECACSEQEIWGKKHRLVARDRGIVRFGGSGDIGDNKPFINPEIDAEIQIEYSDGIETFPIPRGAKMFCGDGIAVINGSVIAEWSNAPKVGDKVIFSKYAGATIQKLGKKYRLIQDKDLGAVIEEPHKEQAPGPVEYVQSDEWSAGIKTIEG